MAPRDGVLIDQFGPIAPSFSVCVNVARAPQHIGGSGTLSQQPVEPGFDTAFRIPGISP